ncbi:protein-disulfide reductase DsbD family protein [Pyruvatibacter mobilis]|uniref:protein-disulfide reductase DsbD family protein n=1 Tax=Pyruvatibacter mobilis TaxID=1712261 RepID=UPI003BA8FFF3
MTDSSAIGRFVCAGILALTAVTAWSGSVRAQSASSWAETDYTAVRLVSASDSVGSSQEIGFGLHFRMKDGWKVYWRSAGDAGYPPKLDWSGSDNIDRVTISWPAPERFQILGFNTLGYRDDVVLPLTVRLKREGARMVARVGVDYLTCKEICIPIQENLELTLSSGPASPSPEAHLISRFLAKVPGPGEGVGLRLESAKLFGPVASNPDEAVLRVSIASAEPLNMPDVFVEGPQGIVFSEPSVQVEGGGRKAVLDVPLSGLRFTKRDLTESPMTLTFVASPLAAEFRATPAAGGTDIPSDISRVLEGNSGQISIWPVIGLALLGGLILNLMPCVLPVLSIKLLGAVGHGGRDSGPVRRSFIASAAGIQASFLVLAGALIGVKAAGATVGWGIQFQSPWFLVAMTILVTLFACNLWGFFDARLPRWAMDTSESMSAKRTGLTGNFLTGAFATLLATPCSAPFLGTAVGFALARGPAEILVIFSALGVGLAAPYLVVAAFPRLVTKLPRPGRWMIILRRVLGFALAGTGVWLLTVLAAEIGWQSTALVGGITTAIGAVLYLLSRGSPKPRAALASVSLLALLALLTPQLSIQAAPQAADSGTKEMLGDLWRPFDEKTIPTLVAQGKTVFVDVTAEWCITCKANKRLVLSDTSIVERLKEKNVIAMQADWTLPDDQIAAYLARYERYGIPFNAVYGPGAPRGVMLPEILSKSGVLAALDEAQTR